MVPNDKSSGWDGVRTCDVPSDTDLKRRSNHLSHDLALIIINVMSWQWFNIIMVLARQFFHIGELSDSTRIGCVITLLLEMFTWSARLSDWEKARVSCLQWCKHVCAGLLGILLASLPQSACQSRLTTLQLENICEIRFIRNLNKLKLRPEALFTTGIVVNCFTYNDVYTLFLFWDVVSFFSPSKSSGNVKDVVSVVP